VDVRDGFNPPPPGLRLQGPPDLTLTRIAEPLPPWGRNRREAVLESWLRFSQGCPGGV